MAKRKVSILVEGYVHKEFKAMGQKRQKDAMAICNEVARKLGWELVGPYRKEV